MPFVGHAPVVSYLQRVGPEGLAHAYLLWGPRGVGKSTFARTLALTLHCERPRSFPTGYCGTCGACRRGLAGSSGDTVFVDDAFIESLDSGSDRKVAGVNIEAAREIVRLMQLRSYEGGRLVCIIPSFDKITFDYVYNTFLKELEEPDQGKLFLLTSERPERILPTIRSRVCSIRFGGLSQDLIADTLIRQYGEEPGRARSLANRAQGSLGDALALRDGDTSDLRDAARRWALACLERPGSLPPMPPLGNDDTRAALETVLRHARSALRDCLAFAVGGEGEVFDAQAVPEYRVVCAKLGPNAAVVAANALSIVGEAERIASTNVAPSAVLGWLQVQLRTGTGAGA